MTLARSRRSRQSTEKQFTKSEDTNIYLRIMLTSNRVHRHGLMGKNAKSLLAPGAAYTVEIEVAYKQESS